MSHIGTTADYRTLPMASSTDIDLHSRSATKGLQFDFPLKQSEQSPICLLRCTDPLATCIAIKQFFLVSCNHPELSNPGIVRMQHQELHRLEEGKEGWMLLAADVAFIENNPKLPVTIMGIIIPGDNTVRWSYHILSITSLLRDLDKRRLLHLHSYWRPGALNHARFTTYIRESFLAAVTIPHAPDYLNAIQITDCCPSIVEPETALRRLESNEVLYFAHKNPLESCLDLEDDRYLLHLEPAEREVASIGGLRCAEYMFVKRNFFRTFFELIYRSEKKFQPDASATSRTQKSYKGYVPGGRAQPEEEEIEAKTTPQPMTPQTHDREEEDDDDDDQTTPMRRSSRRTGTPHSQDGTTEDSLTVRSGRVTTGSETPMGPARRSRAARTNTPVRTTRHSAVWMAAAGTRKTRVRTDTAHQHWLEPEYGMKGQRAKLMVAAWRELGFLDESRYVEWVKAGGIGLCTIEEEGEEEDGERPL